MTRSANESLASSLASLPVPQRARLLSRLTDDELLALFWDWRFWARPNQLAPPDPEWLIWLLMTGRGFGKTRSGAGWTQERADAGSSDRWIALIGATPADVRDYQIERGPSSILKTAPPWARPVYFPSKRLLVWPSGAKATVFSAQKPDQLRGFSGDTAWIDEFAKFRNPQEVLDNLLFGMREAKISAPQICITTTPRPLQVLKDLMGDDDVRVVTGTSYENRANLDPRWFRKILSRYEGTATGQQEIHGRLLDEMPGARWQRKWINDHRVRRVPDELERIVVAVDPPGSSKQRTSAECGIIVAGMKRDAEGEKHLYVLDDLSLKASPKQWGATVVKAYHEWRADLVVGEVNYGGEMVEHTVRTVETKLEDGRRVQGKHVVYKSVTATRGKVIRAEPISSLYEQGRGHHCRDFPPCEDELCTWEPDKGLPSPNRLDALVWAGTELILGDEQPTRVVLPELRR